MELLLCGERNVRSEEAVPGTGSRTADALTRRDYSVQVKLQLGSARSSIN